MLVIALTVRTEQKLFYIKFTHDQKLNYIECIILHVICMSYDLYYNTHSKFTTTAFKYLNLVFRIL